MKRPYWTSSHGSFKSFLTVRPLLLVYPEKQTLGFVRISAGRALLSNLIGYGPTLLGWHGGSLASQFTGFAAENKPAKEQHIGKNQQRRYRGYRFADFMS